VLNTIEETVRQVHNMLDSRDPVHRVEGGIMAQSPQGWGQPHLPQKSPQEHPPGLPTSWYKRPWSIPNVVAVLFAIAVGGCTVPKGESMTTASSETHRINGTFLLRDTYINLDAINPSDLLGPDREWKNGDACSGDGGYDDVQSGLGVTVKEEAGTVIGTSSLDAGVITDGGCQFAFTVGSIPRANFYQIEVGRRGQVRYSYDQIVGTHWSVSLTLG
jgi:hypothetical protein